MTMHAPISQSQRASNSGALVTAAARCWRRARDGGAPVQQSLYAMLAPNDCGLLAPVFDSLMTLCEAALGRKIAVGSIFLSQDELLLLGLLDGSRQRHACIACAEGAASALDCAICSTRIMMALVMGRALP
ncbi:hypothetical protein [Stakelama tenebrarum]|uniref:Uncharacterized protein n=1 Tax=Stakelama tenebrarum TaxID=2711215 RepID=A0A6G6Y0X6_9SPHN|nr:hypothetical protein [Sphingosinithalassobacter tenebrarum]QIG78560.1 hypothetical protein G5C33_01325 [Sphingosinithalassobacter tenebrarum]